MKMSNYIDFVEKLKFGFEHNKNEDLYIFLLDFILKTNDFLQTNKLCRKEKRKIEELVLNAREIWIDLNQK